MNTECLAPTLFEIFVGKVWNLESLSNNCDSNRFVASRFEELPLGQHMYDIQICTLGDFRERKMVGAEDICDFLMNLEICRQSRKHSESKHFSPRAFQELTPVGCMNHIPTYVWGWFGEQILVDARDFVCQVLNGLNCCSAQWIHKNSPAWLLSRQLLWVHI